MILAGFETTANSLTYALLELAKNPSIQKKLQTELKALPIEDQIHSVFLDCAIKESRRIHPAVSAASARVVSKDFIVEKNEEKGLQNDMIIPKGTHVSCRLMLRSKMVTFMILRLSSLPVGSTPQKRLSLLSCHSL
mmetsp:Transcript_7783/g.8906  ORF Transcript_7783/g.8906 Transcript_7783/m.8906 type:complete len:136 (-) Transcript_7783:403-810(-)